MLFKSKKIKQEQERRREAEERIMLEKKRREEELELERKRHEEELARLEAERINANPVSKYKFSVPEPKPKELISVLSRMLQKTFPDARKAFLLLTQYEEKSGYLLIVDIDVRFLKIINLYLDGETKPVRNSLPIECILYSKSGSLTEGVEPFYVKHISESEKSRKGTPTKEKSTLSASVAETSQDIVFSEMPEFPIKGNLPHDERFEMPEKTSEAPAKEDVTEEKTSSEQIIEEVAAEELVAEEPVVEESVAEEAVVEEPIVEEPVVEEAVVEETVVKEAVVEEAVAEEPVVEEQIVEEPVVEEPIVEEAVAEEPVVEEPIVEEPIVEEPVVEEAVAEEPVVEEAVAEEPVVEEAVVEEVVAEEPVVEEPVVEEAVVEEPVVEEAVVEEPIVEKPVIEEQIVEEAVVEEPVIEEPLVEKNVKEKKVKVKPENKHELFAILNEYGLSPTDASFAIAKAAFGEYKFYIPYIASGLKAKGKIFDSFPSGRKVTLSPLINAKTQTRAVAMFTEKEDAEKFIGKQNCDLVYINYKSFKKAHRKNIFKLDSFDGIIINPNSENVFLPCDYPLI